MYVIDTTAPNPADRLEPAGVRVERGPDWNALVLERPAPVLSSAPVGGGEVLATRIVNLCVDGPDARALCDDPPRAIERLAGAHGWPGVIVGMLTGVGAGRLGAVRRRVGEVDWLALATVGVRNAHRAGAPPLQPLGAGTINLVAYTPQALTGGARAEALALACEAKCAALAARGIASTNESGPATGTGTDAIAVASGYGETVAWTGYHTDSGHALALAVCAAMRLSLDGGGTDTGGGRTAKPAHGC